MNTDASTADLLTAASVLAALLTFLYGAAYSAIREAAEIERGERVWVAYLAIAVHAATSVLQLLKKYHELNKS